MMNWSFPFTENHSHPDQSIIETHAESQIVSYQQLVVARKIMHVIQLSFSIIGVITNIVNIRVFWEQGVRTSSTNIGLFSLSVFDFINCLFTIPGASCIVFEFMDDRFQTLVCHAYLIHCSFVASTFYYCSSWTTVYLSIERALCVVLPLKVKQILRPKVTSVVILTFVLIFLTRQIIYVPTTRIVWYFDAISNSTAPILITSLFGQLFLKYYSLAFHTIFNSIAIVVVAMATALMIFKLNKFRKWRLNNNSAAGVTCTKSPTVDGLSSSSSSSSAKKKAKVMSSRDAEMVQSVTIVTSIFLVCLSVGHFPAVVMLLFPGATFGGTQDNLFNITYNLRFCSSAVNSAVNFFFYIRMSSRYKTAFSTAFPNLHSGGRCRSVSADDKNKKEGDV